MKAMVSEFPKHPLPERPRPSSQPPTPIVYEPNQWEYKVIERKPSEELLAVDELNALGRQGWELTGVVSVADAVRFYFKRLRD